MCLQLTTWTGFTAAPQQIDQPHNISHRKRPDTGASLSTSTAFPNIQQTAIVVKTICVLI